MKTESYFTIIRKGKFTFYWWVPGYRIGIYRMYYDSWHLTVNLFFFSLGWEY